MLRPAGLLQGMTIGLLGIFSVLMILSLSTKLVIKFNGIPNEFLIYVVVFFLVAVTEETLSRGFIFANMYSHGNRYIAFFLSSLIFSLLHAFNSSFNWISMLNIFLVGIFLCQMYIRGMSLAMPIGFHFAWNLFQGPVFGFSVSGFSASGIFSIAKSAGDKFSFEGFGLEGSVISTIVLVLFIVADILYGARKNKYEKPVVADSGI